jgi:hypothetical protein
MCSAFLGLEDSTVEDKNVQKIGRACRFRVKMNTEL